MLKVVFISQPPAAIAEMTRFLSQIAILWPGRHCKISFEPTHADLHAEHSEDGCKHDGKIGKSLMQKTSSLDRLHSSGHQKTHKYKNQP